MKILLSYTEENYLKAIYTLNDLGQVTTNAIASKLNTSAASVSDMLKKLKRKELIDYEKYQSINLSHEGEMIAIAIIRKHRLWEYFLVVKLGFGWDEVHDIAEQLEHIKSTKLTDRLADFLGQPKYDPHGDPIPNKEGIFPKKLTTTLEELSPADRAEIIGVSDHSHLFSEHLKQLGLDINTKIEIQQKNEFDRSMVLLNNKKPITISQKVAEGLLVKKI